MTRALRLALALALAGTTPILPGAPDAAAMNATC